MKTVLTFGTYDLFHPGHDFFLRAASTYGDRLVVVVARDTNVLRIKGRAPHDNENKRRTNVQAHAAVDEARLGYEEWGRHLQVLEDIQPDIICLGYDQHATLPDGPWKVVTLEGYKPHKYKSSLMRPQA